MHAALRSDLEALRVRPHALDDADDLGARLHDHLAAALPTADQYLRVRLLVEVHLAVRSCRRHGTAATLTLAPNPYQVKWYRRSSPNPNQMCRSAP